MQAYISVFQYPVAKEWRQHKELHRLSACCNSKILALPSGTTSIFLQEAMSSGCFLISQTGFDRFAFRAFSVVSVFEYSYYLMNGCLITLTTCMFFL